MMILLAKTVQNYNDFSRTDTPRVLKYDILADFHLETKNEDKGIGHPHTSFQTTYTTWNNLNNFTFWASAFDKTTTDISDCSDWASAYNYQTTSTTYRQPEQLSYFRHK
jgi:hypothetical protein